MDILVATSLRRLRAFLMVCDTLHIGRAAQQLGIAQPALSEQIRGLELALGVRLFHRRKRGIDLTAAGAAYRTEAARLLASHQAAADIARRTARGEVGSLAIGYVASAMFNGDFPLALGGLKRNYPDLVISLREGGIAEIRSALSAGELDVALLRAPMTLSAGYDHRIAAQEELVVALSSEHFLARRAALSLADLSEQPMIGFNDASGIGIERVISELAEEAGTLLRIDWRVSTMTSLLGLAGAGLGFGIVPGGLSRISIPGVCFLPLLDAVRTELWYVWKTENISPSLRRLLETVAREAPTR